MVSLNLLSGLIIILIIIIAFVAVVIFYFYINNIRVVRPKDINAAVWEVKLNDILPGTLVKFVKNKSIEKITKNNGIPIPIIIKDKHNKPIQDVSIIMVSSNSSELKYKTGSDGIFTVKLSSTLTEENPLLKISKEGLKAGDFYYEIGGKTIKITDESEEFDVINLSSLNLYEKNGIKVYHNKEDLDNAKKLAETLKDINFKIKQVLGISSLEPMSALLTKSKNVSTIGTLKEKENVIPININDKEQIYWIYTHETTELNLIMKKAPLYSKNKYLRWIGDGLAEYASLKIIEQTDKELKTKMLNSRIKDIDKDKKQSFNLLKWEATTGSNEGYGYSLAFWIDIEEKYGNKVIQEFVNKFLNTNDYSTENITNILIKLIEKDNEQLDKNQIFTLTKEEAKEILLKRLQHN